MRILASNLLHLITKQCTKRYFLLKHRNRTSVRNYVCMFSNQNATDLGRFFWWCSHHTCFYIYFKWISMQSHKDNKRMDGVFYHLCFEPISHFQIRDLATIIRTVKVITSDDSLSNSQRFYFSLPLLRCICRNRFL